MKPLFIYDEAQPVTLGQLCEALADGVVPATRNKDCYELRRGDVSRLAEVLLVRHASKQRVGTEACKMQ